SGVRHLRHIQSASHPCPRAIFPPASPHLRHLPSFPTRRSSDLPRRHRFPHHHDQRLGGARVGRRRHRGRGRHARATRDHADPAGDRKSTRLNSSHQIISYAVFCLKKKKIYIVNYTQQTKRHVST